MNITPQTATRVYLRDKECLHILATVDQLRVRWMRDGAWMLRWNAFINGDGMYINTRLDGTVVDALQHESFGHTQSDLLLNCMRDAAARLPLYANPDIVRELAWFVLDDSRIPG